MRKTTGLFAFAPVLILAGAGGWVASNTQAPVATPTHVRIYLRNNNDRKPSAFGALSGFLSNIPLNSQALEPSLDETPPERGPSPGLG